MKKIEVVAAVIYRNKEIFITQRCGGAFDGLWEFPGGKIENQETHHETIIREIKEELNVEIEIDGFLTTVEYDYPDFHLTMHLYWSRIVSGEIELLEHADGKWLDYRLLKNVDWIPADIDVVNVISNSSFL